MHEIYRDYLIYDMYISLPLKQVSNREMIKPHEKQFMQSVRRCCSHVSESGHVDTTTERKSVRVWKSVSNCTKKVDAQFYGLLNDIKIVEPGSLLMWLTMFDILSH